MEAPTLNGLSREEVIGYMRWRIQQQVTADGDAWVDRVSGPVRDTPGKDHMDLGWLGTIGEFVDVSVGGIPLHAIRGEKVRRDYSPFANGMYVLSKHRRRPSPEIIQAIQDRIDSIGVTYGRIWPLQLLKTIRESATSTVTKRSKCIDGKQLYATDHVDPSDSSATVSNKVVMDVVDITDIQVAEAEKFVWAMVEQLMTRKDDQGRAIHEDKDEFDIFCGWGLRRVLAYALGAPNVLEGGQSRTNLLATTVSGVKFNLISTIQLSSWGATQLAMHVSDGRSFWRGRDSQSLDIETEEKGISEQRTEYATIEERGVGAFDWQSGLHVTLQNAS